MFAPVSTTTFLRGARLLRVLLVVLLASTLSFGCRRKPAVEPPAEGSPEALQRDLDAATKADPQEAGRVKAVRPLLYCVERVSATEWRAHFGYVSSAPQGVPISVSAFNRFWPTPDGRNQPTAFDPGTHKDVLQVSFTAVGSTAWSLGSAFAVANARSAPAA